MKKSKNGFAFPEKTAAGLKPYTDFKNLVETNQGILKCSIHLQYIFKAFEKLINYHAEVTDCYYSIDTGGAIRPLKKQNEDDTLYESDYILRIINLKNSNILDIYIGLTNEDSSYELSMCKYVNNECERIIECDNLTVEVAEYMVVLNYCRSGKYVTDRNCSQDSKRSVYKIEMEIHNILKK